jgi:hypothetical protein
LDNTVVDSLRHSAATTFNKRIAYAYSHACITVDESLGVAIDRGWIHDSHQIDIVDSVE